MTRNIASAFFVILTLVFVAEPLYAIDPPHNQVSCSYCHVAHRDQGPLQPSNVCLSCHANGQAAGASPFSLHDMANPFGTFTSVLSGTKKKTQSSHNWSSPDSFPAAGSQPPTNTNMNAISSLKGKVTCARCHEIHASKTDTSRGPKLLRMKNDSDAMCLDCHRSRNTTSHLSGSHPIDIDYTAIAAVNPTKFNATPALSNPANPTTALKLQNGKIYCTTCHGVHFTDSNSSSFDNRSGAILSKLSTSTGALLRVSARGETSTSINICTVCHTSKMNHNGTTKQQNIQCVDCHGGHVEYDPLDPNGPKNVFLVNRYMNFSTAYGAVRNKRVFFQYTGASNMNYKDAAGTGICQGCHTVPTGGTYPPQHSLSNASADDCKSCHNHSSSTGSFSGGCTSCHGFPPKLNVAGGPDGYAVNGAKNYNTSGVFKDESKTPHAAHAGAAPYSFSCDQCHKGNAHDSGTFQDVFLDKTGLVASTSGANPSYNGSCSTTYCHSNGAPRGGTSSYKSVIWENGKNTIAGTVGECNACHGDSATLGTNAHARHASTVGAVGKAYNCDVCHAATVSGRTTIINKAKHVDGAKDISIAGWNSGAASCSNSCHSDGKGGAPIDTPVWTNPGTGQCGSCHALLVVTNAHSAHYNATYGPNFGTSIVACQKCHSYTGELDATHVNGTINFLAGYSATSCSPCHPTGSSLGWSVGTRLACTSCHAATPSVINSVSAPYKAQFATTGHGKYGNQCSTCHNQNSSHITAALGDGKRLVASLGDGSTNTECLFCHNNSSTVTTPAFQNMSTHFTVKGGSQNMLCRECHDLHGTSNLSMIKESIRFINSTTWTITYTDRSNQWVNTTTNRGLCQVCHTQTTHYRAGVAETQHPTTGCFSCHAHRAVGGAFKPQGDCNSCHGYPPAPKNVAVSFGTTGNWENARFEDYSGGGGAHLVEAHIPKTATKAQGWANCTICHNSGNVVSAPNHKMTTPVKSHISNVTVAVDPRYRYVPSEYAIYSGAKLFDPPAVNKTGSCFNVSCHPKPSPRWSTER